jgi:hypothetical protein
MKIGWLGAALIVAAVFAADPSLAFAQDAIKAVDKESTGIFTELLRILIRWIFPLGAAYALLPGKWTALLHFAKVFFSVKLWPFGWALLTAFTERRPSALALADAASDLRAHAELAVRIGEAPNLFATITLMYFAVPALTFMAVQLVSHAASLPFQSAMPRPSGGNAAGAAAQAAAALAA